MAIGTGIERAGTAVTAEQDQLGGISAPPEQVRPRSKKRRIALFLAVFWMGALVTTAIAARLDILPLAPYDRIVDAPNLTPGFRFDEPLGTDSVGRSVTSRVAYGAGVSLVAGFAPVLIAFLLGGALGVLAGYRKRWTDRGLSTAVDALLAFPGLILLLALAAMLTPSLSTTVIALAIIFTPTFFRLSRANTLSLSPREFVRAAKASGARTGRVVRRELAPSISIFLISYASILVASAIVAEGSLSFLGLGIPPPTPSWGGMIAAGRPDLATDPSLVFVPGAFLLFTVIALNVIGDWTRQRYARRATALNS
jgi:peptide/nickel transport system permease protein